MPHKDRRATSVIIAGLFVAVSMLAATGATYAQSPVTPPGSGTQADPYLISELGHLVWMGDTAVSSSGKYYTMTADIDASATAAWNDAGTDTTVLEGFKPIGASSDPDTTSFRGIIDGNGHTITGLAINRPSTYYVGLFGYLGTGGLVRNLSMESGAVTGLDCVGSVVGQCEGTVSNCYATGAVKGSSYVGGVVGRSIWGAVSDCYATVTIRGTTEYVGGLVGATSYGTVSSCHATGVVAGGDGVGGLVGRIAGSTVSNCYATSTITGTFQLGGLAGISSGSVLKCYASGAVTGDEGVGGLVGFNRGMVSDCHAIGAAKGSQTVGGLIGTNEYGTVAGCYSSGVVTGSAYVGGLVGYTEASTVSTSYWDKQTSGQNASAGGTGKTTAEMKQQATFVGWDFVTIWSIAENVTYPLLRSLSDSDGDGVIDQIDACPGTVPGAAVDALGCPPVVSGDFNHDGDVDSADFDGFEACTAGPAIPYPNGCDTADFDDDDDVDQSDFGILQRCYSGEGIPAAPGCAN